MNSDALINRTITIDSAEQPHHIFIKESGEYQVELTATGCEVFIWGGWRLQNQETLHIDLKIVHQAPHTQSNTLLRGVAEDESKISLSGTIIVEPNAQNINAFLTENILLLSDTAQAEAIPNLEIEANQVKCSHAATVANIDEEHLFYFASRGIPAATAKEMIIDGFLAEVSPTSQEESAL